MSNQPKRMKLDYLKMLKEIYAFLETDWAFEMDCKMMPNAKPFTQKEAKEMSEVLGKIYSIAHCIDCNACQTKYLLPNKRSKIIKEQ